MSYIQHVSIAQSGSNGSRVLAVALVALACGGPRPQYSRIRAGGELWCPIGMDVPTPADVRWTSPVSDPLGRRGFFSVETLQFAAQCPRVSIRNSPENPCEHTLERAQQRLSDLGEPVLRERNAGFAAIRIVYTHGFPYRPVTLIRVSKSTSGVVLVAKVLESEEPRGRDASCG